MCHLHIKKRIGIKHPYHFHTTEVKTFGDHLRAYENIGISGAMYIRRIMLKVENKVSMARVKEILRQEYISQQASPLMRGLSLAHSATTLASRCLRNMLTTLQKGGYPN